jgi:CopG family nickel-responsive transcriptional regulator
MKQELVRFGVAMEARLIAQLDEVAAARGSTRSEVLRDLARAEVTRSLVQTRVPAVAAVTLVYNHHVRELSERLTAIQHDFGESVRSTMHVHLDHDHCLEVIVMRGRSDELKSAADQLLGTRGVTHGGVEIIAENVLGESGPLHGHKHPHAHAHSHEPIAKKRAASKTR